MFFGYKFLVLFLLKLWFVFLSVLEREIYRERQKREGHEVGYVEMWGGREDLEGIE